MRQYETIEFCYTAPAPEGSEAAVNLQAEFIHERERTVVKGFYAGNQTYIVRFLPSKAGKYQYRVFGIVNASGSFFAEPAAGSHGMVQAEGRHFRYQDGTSYLPVGTTVYALVHQTEELIEETMDTLKHSPFNKIRLCVFPKNYLYNRNEPLYYPFEKDAAGQWDVHHPCFAYWDFLEKQLRRLADMGYKELVLGGIQLSAYGPDLPDKPDLADVIEQLSGIEGISRIRLGSLEPLLINDEFVRRLRKCESLCPQFHLSLQSGSDSVLKRMNRKYNTNEYEGAVACLRENYDNPAITTDIIVGFPGETQEEFEQTQAFMQKIGFASVHVFAYSRRAGTAADKMPGQISPEVKKERSHVLLEQAAKDSLGYCQSFEGKIRPVLFETFKVNVLKGLTPEHLEVRVISDINLAGEIRDVRLTCGQDGLTGELLV